MNTTAAPRLVLLLKSGPGTGTSIAHKGGYALYGNPPRWRKITPDKPAPKGAPVAAHPKSAGHHEPAAHFTDDQWAALKLPDSNVNAPVFNKALEKLRAWSDAGDVTAIVGAGFGTNTYAARLVKLANHLLGLHGSAHKVTPGQKPGTHAASQVAEPADPHPTGLPEHLAPKAAEPEAEPVSAPAPAAASGPLTMPDFEEGKTTTGVKAHYEHVAQKVIDHGHAGNGVVLEDMKADGLKPNHKGKVSNTWSGKTANSKKLLALHAAALAHAKGEGSGYAAPAAAADTDPKEGDTKPMVAADPKPASDPMSEWTAFTGKHWGLINEVDDVQPFLKDPKMAGPAALSAYGAGGFVEINSEPSAPASKALLSYVSKLPQFDPGKKLHRVMGFGSQKDVDGYLKQLQPASDAPGAQIKTVSSWTTKDPAAPGQTPMNNIALDLSEQFGEHKVFVTLDAGHKSAKDVSFLYSKEGKAKPGGDVLLPVSTKLDVVSVKKDGLNTHVVVREVHEGDTKPGADGSTLVLKDGHWVKQGGDPAPATPPAATGSLSAQQLGNLQSIPWFKLKLPAENTNAKSHNAAIAKIEAMAFAGDVAGLKAFADSKAGAKQTYAKKQHLLAMSALDFLSGTGPTPEQKVRAAKVATEGPAADTPIPANVKKTIDGMSKDESALEAVVANNAHNPHIAAYAASKLAALKGAPEPGPAAAAPDPYPLVNEWKAAIVAGKVPTKAQADAFDTLGDHDPDAQQEYFLDAVSASIPSSVPNHGGEFDTAYQAANKKVHELHGHALAGTKPAQAAPVITADTPLSRKQLAALESLTLKELKAIQNGPGLGANVLAYLDKEIASLEGTDVAAIMAAAKQPAPATPVQVKSAVFHNTTAGHNKFWSASIQGSTLKTMYGKIGSKGQSTVKEFSSPAAAVSAYQDLIDEKKSKGYQYQGQGVHLHDAPAVSVEQGPKEGDTKQGADGMLVLKNGHWVKMDDGAGGWAHTASDPGLSGNPSLTFEKDGSEYYLALDGDSGFEFGVYVDSYSEPDHIQASTLAELLPKMKAMGHPIPPVAALQKLDPSYKPAPVKIKKAKLIDISTAIQAITPGQTKFSGNSAGKMATAAAKAADGPGMAAAHAKAIALDFLKTASHIKAVADVMGVDTSAWDGAATPAAATPAPAAAPTTVGGMLSMDGWAQTGGQGGSNPGGKFKDPAGQEWYCKFPKDADTAKSEILAAKLYALTGLSSQDAVLVTKDGKVGIASKWVNIKKAASPGALAKVDGAQAGFAVDAWLGNWDVVGLSYDNLQVGPNGKAHRVDAGGSLEYRAQGEKKAFGSKVEELDTLLDGGKNAQTASVFKGMTKADLTASAAKVLAISDVAIRTMVNQYGPGDAAAKAKLADTLIARKKDIAAKFPEAAKKKKAPVFKPEEISAPPSFLNWGGKGSSGPSSKEFLNKANEDAVQAIFAAAKTGDADAVKKLTAPVFDKDTGAVTGHKPVLEHPSQHVKGYAQQAINEITYQLNPPKQFRFDGGHPLHSLNAAYPAHKGSPSSAVAQKLGKFIVLGEPGTVSLADVGLTEKIVHGEGGGTLSAQTYAKQAQAAIAKMPATQKQAVKSYTGSSYHAMNGSLWSGNPTGAAKAAGEALKTLGHDIAPGTVLSRKISLHGADLQHLLGASGKILQEPAIMSTSIRPSSWSGNVHLKLHVGPGVKGLWVGHHSLPGGGALSSNSGEDEMILPPGTRLMIVGVKTGSDKDGFGKSSGHVVEAIILPTE